jgi:AhpD family alkylhydroperoxidase
MRGRGSQPLRQRRDYFLLTDIRRSAGRVLILKQVKSMNALNQREQELVILGAAMGSNCVPCIERHVPGEAGLKIEEIAEAIRLSDMVRRTPARKVLDAARALLTEPSAAAYTATGSPVDAEASAAASRKSCCSPHE